VRARLHVGRLMLVDSVKMVKGVGDCFIYTTASNRINHFVGNESYTISPSDTYVSRLSSVLFSLYLPQAIVHPWLCTRTQSRLPSQQRHVHLHLLTFTERR